MEDLHHAWYMEHINRITVEFKFSKHLKVFVCCHKILIESQWNLNMIADLIISFVISILIESQWNLNKFVSVCMFAVLHINRITVEFKFTWRNNKCVWAIILIESQWNLNDTGKVKQLYITIILIESQWNLNTRIIATIKTKQKY